MGKRKAMLIIGPSRSGKTMRAWREAEKDGGRCITTFQEEIQRPFGLGRVLGLSPDVVVVEGLSLAGLDVNLVKRLVSGEDILIAEQYKEPRFVPAPRFIFTVLTPPALDLGAGFWSRFEVVVLGT